MAIQIKTLKATDPPKTLPPPYVWEAAYDEGAKAPPGQASLTFETIDQRSCPGRLSFVVLCKFHVKKTITTTEAPTKPLSASPKLVLTFGNIWDEQQSHAQFAFLVAASQTCGKSKKRCQALRGHKPSSSCSHGSPIVEIERTTCSICS